MERLSFARLYRFAVAASGNALHSRSRSHRLQTLPDGPWYSQRQGRRFGWHSRSSRAFSTACDGSQSGDSVVWA